MIRVVKPATPPAALSGRGAARSASDRAAFDSDPVGFRDGSRTFEFDSGIYGHETVKQALIEAQRGKCCFCESKVTHVAHGDVEHFRPKAGYQQDAADNLQRPGYYWLAYEWSNLFFSCQLCNQRHKKSLFPLDNPTRRARSHADDPLREKPLFLDPARDDPERSIGFRDEAAVALRGSRRAVATIEQLGLNRTAVAEKRKVYLTIVRRVINSRRLLLRARPRAVDAAERAEIDDEIGRIDAVLRDARGPDAEYCSMIRAALRAAGLA